MAILEVFLILGLLAIIMNCLVQIVPVGIQKSDKLLLIILIIIIVIWGANTTMLLYLNHTNHHPNPPRVSTLLHRVPAGTCSI
jgi:hypothetical protein